MTTGVLHHEFLMRLDDQEPGSRGERSEDADNGNDYGLDGATRMPARMKYESGIHGLSLSCDRYPRFFPL